MMSIFISKKSYPAPRLILWFSGWRSLSCQRAGVPDVWKMGALMHAADNFGVDLPLWGNR